MSARPFAEIFAQEMRETLPFELPPDCGPCEHDGIIQPALVGTAPARGDPLLIASDVQRVLLAPDGYFLTGFWGYGVNSYAYYLAEVRDGGAWRAYFRLPYGGVYSDNEAQRVRVLAFLREYIAFRAAAPRLALRGFTAFDSMGDGHYRLEYPDGAERVERTTLFGRPRFRSLLIG